LVNTETAGRDVEKSAVCGDFVTNCNRNDVAGYKFGRMNATKLRRPEDLGFVWRIFLESLEEY